MAEKILVVEDEIALQETLAYNLKRQGYEVQTCGDGLCALEAARSFRPDLVLLDVMLPGMDGFEVCRVIRQEMTTPVLMLTARDDEIDRVVGPGGRRGRLHDQALLDARADGAGQGHAAPRAPDPRGDADRGRRRPAAFPDRIVFGALVIDLTRREVRLTTRCVWRFKPKEYELLALPGPAPRPGALARVHP